MTTIWECTKKIPPLTDALISFNFTTKQEKVVDIIQLLPDNIANQIAAGEVIQRPASAVKELLENAVDAGATEIKLVTKDAGKELVQVIDNGCGMSETDARMSFERHATSKIASIDDLFHIRTMGFRGEALASIAAVSQVEIKTKKHDAELGTFIEIDNSIVKKQEPCQCEPGTSFSMKNLFFNMPGRKNFLKSNNVEMRHIIEEFTHVALAFPDIFFSLNHNSQQVFHLEKSSLKQRIIGITTSASVKTKLVTVKEETDYMNIYGFVGKPEAAKKTRGDQYFFVNNRYIKSAYLNHAVTNAYNDMISSDSFPLYVLFIDLNPAHIDINVHPTKQEIKFEDEKVIYAFVMAAVKHALAQFSIMPTLDFKIDADTQQLSSINQPFTEKEKARSESSSIYQGFTRQHQAHFIESKNQLPHWKEVYGEPKRPAAGTETFPSKKNPAEENTFEKQEDTREWQAQQEEEKKLPVQLHQRYIMVQLKSGFILLDQRLAHERILFERYSQTLSDKPASVQQSLFPQTVKLQSADAALLIEMLPDLKHLGYELEPFGKDTFIIQGTPADLDHVSEQASIEGLLEQYKHFNNNAQLNHREKLVHSLARNNAILHGRALLPKEMQHIIDQLFACKQPNYSPDGRPVFLTFKLEDLAKMFNG